MPSRTEITIETERAVIIRRSVRVWCEECGRTVEMLSLGEAEVLAAAPGQEICLSAHARGWHLSRNQQGSCLVCLESLRRRF